MDTPASSSPIQTGQSVSFGWQTLKQNFWFLVGVAVVSTIISGIGSDPRGRSAWDWIGLFTSIWMTCGTITIYLAFRRGQKPDFAALFTSVSQYFSVLGATILYGLLIGLGFVLLVIPGIYWAIKYQFTIPLIIDQKLGVMEAFRRSGEMTNGKKWALFGFNLAMFGIMLLGLLALGIGILVAMPVVGLAAIDLYERWRSPIQVPAPAGQ